MRRAAIIASICAAIAVPPAHAGTRLVALAHGAPVPADAAPVAPSLGIWRVPAREVRHLRGVVAAGRDERAKPLVEATAAAGPDPLVPQEWWLQAVGADQTPPPAGPGRLVAIVDTGVDVTHPEFSATNVLLLDAQHVTPGAEEFHGTAVASIVGAPNDGKGMQGVYPGAQLASYDAGAQTLGDVLNGIATAIGRSAPGVINLSVGFTGPTSADLLQVAVDSAVAAGWIVVAAAGNGGPESPPVYPADLPHVLTVGATDKSRNVTSFSSRSPYVNLAAPGNDILAAVPTWKDPSGFARLSGTSFAAPIVSGAAALLWTARPALDSSQVVSILESSATDIDAPGVDPASGHGLLDLPAAIATPSPIRDPQEPNEDVELVADGGEFGVGTPPLVGLHHRNGRVLATLAPYDDPADVYRVFVPYGFEVVATVRSGEGVKLGLWGPDTQSIHETHARALRDLIDNGETVRTRNASQRKGAFYYLAATLKRGAGPTSYLVSVALRARP